MSVILVAEESAGIQALRMLEHGRHRVAAVLTAPQTRGGGATVATVAEKTGVPVLSSAMVREPDLAEWIKLEQIDLLLNVHSLYVVHPDVVAAPRIGSFNLHPGPLPEYAGLNAPSWALYRGERRHAATVHWMHPGIDTGPIAYETRFDLTETDTGLSVSVRCAKEGLALIARLLEEAQRGAIPSTPQDLNRRRYFGRDVPDGGAIVWSRSACQVVDFVRACDYYPFASPWGQPRARLDAGDVAVTRASRTGEPAAADPGTVGRVDGESVQVATGDEWILVHRLHVDSQAVAATSVLEPGMRLTDGA
jgi:UDP-4-amino-4-deoxy-L-arabinose formyltransferase/UDP-glucuronic acid dehydrogenase (UDP-4-keto-hexauronic acid decarboxylating)